MSSPLLRAGLLGVVLLLVIACGGSAGGGGTRLLTYERVWPDGRTESQVVWSNGRVEMRHGDMLERLTLPGEDVDRLEEALEQPIPTDAPGASPERTLTLADGTVIAAPRPDPGTITELLDRYMDTHLL